MASDLITIHPLTSLTLFVRELTLLAPTTKQSDEMHESTGSPTQYTNTEKLVVLLPKERRTGDWVRVLGITTLLQGLLGGGTTRELSFPRRAPNTERSEV